VRFVVFAQGCRHRCPGCHNPETWDPSGGEEWSVRDLFRIIRRAPGSVRGITLSGGEPFLQAAQMAELASLAHRQKEWDVVTYTGYVYEDLLGMAEADEEIARLLDMTDILVDGPYVEQFRDIGLRFRGSANQRAIDMRATRSEGRVVLLGED
jgi:anaerobic ribonucleoside-triphosphate reductase activating protein